MTHVSSSYIEVMTSNEKIYQVEVIDFNGVSTIVEVYANNAEEAQQLGAEEVGEADYTTIIAVYA